MSALEDLSGELKRQELNQFLPLEFSANWFH